MTKRVFCLALILALFCALFTGGSASAEEVSQLEFKEVNGVSYADGTTGFVYSDDFFLHGSSEMSGDICKLAVALAGAAYGDGSNLRGMLENEAMGFTVNTFDYGGRTLSDNDRVAFAIADKNLPGGQKLYFVVIRGTENLEWFSDFNMGDPATNGGKHPGFHIAANRVIDTLDALFGADGVSANDTFILFTGHSRGAAVANILAARYNDGTYAPADHIFGYNFACPAVAKSVVAYSNIFNFNNTGDAIPTVPLKDWGYKRNGVDMPCAFTGSPAFRMSFYEQFKDENASTSDTISYELAVKTIFPEETTVKEPLGHFGAMLLAWSLSETTEVSFGDLMLQYGKDVVTFDFLFQQLLEATGLDQAYSLLRGEKTGFQEDVEFLQEAIDYWNEQEDYTQDDFNDWLVANKHRIDRIYRETTHEIKSVADLPVVLSLVIDLAPTALDIGSVIACVMDITDNSAGGPMDAIRDGHRTGTYVVGINALYLGYRACAGLETITSERVPSSVRTLGSQCFYNSSLEELRGIERVEYIGSSAFAACPGLTGVALDAVKGIGDAAFSDCTGLNTLELGTVRTIGASAFQNCSGLEELYIPDTAERLTVSGSIGPFSGCTGLKRISVGGVEKLEPYMFSTGSRVLEKLTIRGTVKEIGDQAFCSDNNDVSNGYNYTSGTPAELVIEEGVKIIGMRAFFQCKAFTSMTVPKTVTSIGDNAFFMCVGPKTLSFADPLTLLGANAFYGCTALESVTLDELDTIGSSAFKGCTALKDLTLGNVRAIEGGAFYGCSALEELYIPDSVKVLGFNVISGCTGLKRISVGGVEKLEPYMLSTGSRVLENLTIRGTVKEIGEQAFCSDSNNTIANNGYHYDSAAPAELMIEEGVERIGAKAFYRCSAFTSMTVPTTVTSIGESAFYMCVGPKTLSFAQPLTQLGVSAFSCCTALESVTLDELDTISSSAFEGCTALKTLTLGNVRVISSYAFYGCSALEELYIPDSVKVLGVHTVAGCTGLKRISVGGVEKLEPYMFSTGSKVLENLTIRGTVKEIGEQAFCSDNNNTLANNGYQYVSAAPAELMIEEGVERIGAKAFYRCSAFTSMTVPTTVTSIGESAFYMCVGPKTLSFAQPLTQLGASAFSCCTALESVTLDELDTISSAAFEGCTALKTLTLGDVRVIGSYAFYGCSAFTSISLPSSVSSIGSSAFSGCSSLNYAVYPGTEEEWNAVAVGSGNTPLLNALLWYRVPDFTLPAALSAVEDEAFTGIAAVSVLVPEGVTAIGDRAFANCPALCQVTLPAGVTAIGEEAFAGRERLLIVGVAGSFAEQYAAAQGYAFLSR